MGTLTLSTFAGYAGNYPSRETRLDRKERKIAQSVLAAIVSDSLTMANKTLTSPAINGTIDSATGAAAVVWSLVDDTVDALTIGAAGATNIIAIDTDNSAPLVTINGDLTVSGTTTTVSTTNTLIKDKLVTLNDGGAAASGGGSGIEIEEDGSVTAYFKQAAARTGWELLSSADANKLTIVTPTAADETLTMTGSLNVEADSVINQDLSSDAAPTFAGFTSITGAINADLVTDSSSVSTGSIICDGGMGLAKALFVGTTINAAGSINADAVTDASAGAGSIVCDGGIYCAKKLVFAATQQIDCAAGTFAIGASMGANALSLGSATGSVAAIGASLDVTGVLNVDDTTTSTSATTGSAIVDGGLGVAENVWAGGTVNAAGQMNADATTQSTSVSTGSLVCDGGMGVAKDVYIGGDLTVAGVLSYTALDDPFDVPIQSHKIGESFTTPDVGDNAVNVLWSGKEMYGVTNITAQTAALLTWSAANGLDVLGDGDASSGFEINPGLDITADSRYAYTVGTDNFFIDMVVAIADKSKQDEMLVGWRKAEAHQDTVAAYADFAALNINATGDVETKFELAGGGDTTTDSVGDDIANGEFARMRVEVDDVQGLASVIALANECKADYNAHFALVSEHTGTEVGTAVAAADASDLATAITLITELLSDYDAHDNDAEQVAPTYHAAQEAGDHSLASAVAPTDLGECIARLNDWKAKYNAHDADSTAHPNGGHSANQASTTDASRVFFMLGKNTTTLSALTVPDAVNLDDAEVMIPMFRILTIGGGGGAAAYIRDCKVGLLN